jgi:alkylation response protein AidB-like acyl-CoA dehydrogenase
MRPRRIEPGSGHADDCVISLAPCQRRSGASASVQLALNAVRIHGGCGYSTEFDVERYVRDAPLMIVGAATVSRRR